MSCSEIQELTPAERQCELLLKEMNVWKKRCQKMEARVCTLEAGREIQRLKIREQAEELQKLEEQLQEEVNFSNSISELLKTNGEK